MRCGFGSGLAADALYRLATRTLRNRAGVSNPSLRDDRTSTWCFLISATANACYGVYVGMSKYSPAQRFDQHKAGIRAAGSVLKRGLEVLTGPTLHLQYIKRAEAARIESQLAERIGCGRLAG